MGAGREGWGSGYLLAGGVDTSVRNRLLSSRSVSDSACPIHRCSLTPCTLTHTHTATQGGRRHVSGHRRRPHRPGPGAAVGPHPRGGDAGSQAAAAAAVAAVAAAVVAAVVAAVAGAAAGCFASSTPHSWSCVVESFVVGSLVVERRVYGALLSGRRGDDSKRDDTIRLCMQFCCEHV